MPINPPLLKGVASEATSGDSPWDKNYSQWSSIIFQWKYIDPGVKAMKTYDQARNTITNGYYLPYNPKLKERARYLRKNMTEAERKIWENFLKDYKYRVLRQKPIDNYIVDFYCAKLKLVIEIDGEIHSSKDNQEYDLIRTKILKGYGLQIIRFSNDEIFFYFERVCNQLSRISLDRDL